MKKTIEEYEKDADIKDYPEPLRELYAIRRSINNEIANMTAAEQTKYFNEFGREYLKKLGIEGAIRDRL